MSESQHDSIEVYIALGGNLGDRFATLQSALSSLKQLSLNGAVESSPIYETEPLGPEGQGAYLNAVARFQTQLKPLNLLAQLQAIEKDHGRVRGEHWGARTLDLDILYYGDQVIDLPDLHVPHMHLYERWFVLRPMSDLNPEYIDPHTHQQVAELLKPLPVTGKRYDHP